MGAILELMRRNVEKYKKHAPEFKHTFGIGLMPSFWNHLTGLGVIAFDEWLNVPDGKSTEDIVRERYGEDAVKLCYALIKVGQSQLENKHDETERVQRG